MLGHLPQLNNECTLALVLIERLVGHRFHGEIWVLARMRHEKKIISQLLFDLFYFLQSPPVVNQYNMVYGLRNMDCECLALYSKSAARCKCG